MIEVISADGMISDNNRLPVPYITGLMPFLDELDGILISGEVGIGKPNPAIFREFLSRFDLWPDKTIYIDDWDLNVAAAASLGMTAIHFHDAAELRTELRRLGVPLAAGS